MFGIQVVSGVNVTYFGFMKNLLPTIHSKYVLVTARSEEERQNSKDSHIPRRTYTHYNQLEVNFYPGYYT